MTPTLETPRLTLVPYTQDLVTERHVRWLNTAELVKYSDQRMKSHSLISQKKYVAGMRDGLDYAWVIRTPVKDIGTITAYVSYDNMAANLGILIGEEQGYGYGTEAWWAVMKFCVNGLGMSKIEAGCMAANRPMIMLALKCGMFIEGTVPDHFDLNGEPEDLVQLGAYYGKGTFIEPVLEAPDASAGGG